VVYFMLFGMLLFCPETGTRGFLSTPPNPSYAVEGENFTLAWNYTLDASLMAVQFSRGVTGGDSIGHGNSIGEMNMTSEYQARFRGQAGSTRAELTILTVQSSDEATYHLNVVSNHATFISDHVDVIVHSPPRNIVTSSDQKIIAPTELTLNCSADGKPKPTITWTRLSDNTVVTMPLIITGGKNKESYRCTADNEVGNPLIKVVKITIQSLPKVILPQKVFVGREQSASLNCKVEGNPTPTISWSPCDVENLPCDKQYLNISKVQSARANYTCTARNYLGIDSATTVLVIGGKNVYLRLSVKGACDNKDPVWKKLEEELVKVFSSTASYSRAELIQGRCESLIFDAVLVFSTEVVEDDTISKIPNAAVDGKLGELSVNVSYYVIGSPPVKHTTPVAPISINSTSDDSLMKIAPIFYLFFILFYILFYGYF